MKKILLTLAGFVATLLSIAQSPNLMNYQGVARNAAGNVLPNQPIGLKLSILTGTPTGAVVYSETRNVTTNAFGLFNVVVGSPGAITTTGTIAGINWTAFGIGSGSKFLQVEIDPVGGTSYVNVGSTQLVSVPYALNAGAAAPVGPAGGDLTGTYPNPTVARLQGRAVSAAAPNNRNLLMWDAGTVSWIPATAAQAGVVSGTGTLNYVPKWTPDGVTIGNSRIFDDGTFVGIGTTTPGAGLVVSGNGIWNSAIGIQNTGTGMEWRMNVNGNTFGITKVPGSTFTPVQLFSTGGMDFSNSAGTSIARFLDNGDVGIGTTAPVNKLEVQGIQRINATTNQEGGELRFQEGNLFGPQNHWIIDNFQSFAGGNRFRIWNDAGSQAISMMPNGRVAVGNMIFSDQPQNTLDVEGSMAVGSAYSGTTAAPVNGAIIEGSVGVGTNAPIGKLNSFQPNATSGLAAGTAIFAQKGTFINQFGNPTAVLASTSGANTIGLAGITNDGFATIGGTVGTGVAVLGQTFGTGGIGLWGIGTSSPTSYALATSGRIQFQGQGAAVNRVLTSDNVGNATWNPLSTIGGVSGTGTLNFIPKWTPDGATIGNSQLFDNGSNVGLGTVSPNARLDIANSNITRGAFITNSSTSNGTSALLVQNNTLTGGGLEGSGVTSFMAPLVGLTYNFGGTATAIKGFSSASAAIGTAGGIGIQGSSASGYGIVGLTDVGTGVLAYGVGTGYGLQTIGRVQISGQGAAAGRVLTSDAAGNATWQAAAGGTKVSLRAGTLPNTVVASNSIVDLIWNSVAFEEGGLNYNTSTGVYTIPVTGLYSISAKYVWGTFASNTGQHNTIINVNGGFAELAADAPNNTGQYIKGEARALLQLNAGDQVKIQVYQSSGSNATVLPFGTSDNNFIIHLVH